MLARRRRQGTHLPAMVQLAERRRGQAPAATSGRGAHPTGRERIFRVFERTGAARTAGSEADRARVVIRRIGAGRLGQRRTALADNNTDYYPVPLSADTLRPGTVYADPYGHILMIVRRISQTEDAAGLILAVAGPPDRTVPRTPSSR